MNSLKRFLLVVAVILAGCSSAKEIKTEKMALGWVDRTVLNDPDYQVFKTTYDTVHVDEQLAEMIGTVGNGVDVTVFFGTWCGDSKRQLPKFLKVADKAGIPADKIKLYGVDRSKKSPDGLAEKYNIQRVPTFLFFKNGVELGRIIETPHTTIEGDMITILAGDQKK
jgi:thiol-disulfide isomerase/thioredoxin